MAKCLSKFASADSKLNYCLAAHGGHFHREHEIYSKSSDNDTTNHNITLIAIVFGGIIHSKQVHQGVMGSELDQIIA